MHKPTIAQSRRTAPTAAELRILEALAASAAALKSSELGIRTGMFPLEFRNACAWLVANGYIACDLRRVKQKIGDARAFKRLAFWRLTDKARAHFFGRAIAQD